MPSQLKIFSTYLIVLDAFVVTEIKTKSSHTKQVTNKTKPEEKLKTSDIPSSFREKDFVSAHPNYTRIHKQNKQSKTNLQSSQEIQRKYQKFFLAQNYASNFPVDPIYFPIYDLVIEKLCSITKHFRFQALAS